MMRPPLSKSDAQRALVLADILGVPFSEVLPPGEALPRDVEVLRDGLIALRSLTARIDCEEGGAPFRFLLTQAAVLPGRKVEFTGSPRLGERPHGPLLAALSAVPRVKISVGKPWPVTVESPSELRGPVSFSVSGKESSQFASSLLLGAARLAARGIEASVAVEGELASEGYFALTCSWLRRMGFTLPLPAGRGEGLLRRVAAPHLSSPRRRRERDFVPGDWSSIGYLLALSWVTGLRVERIALGTGHPDEAVLHHLETIGLKVSDRVEGSASRGFELDAAACPDSIPTLAVIATKLPAPSIFRGVGILRHKESDRVAGIQTLLSAAGLRSALEGETLTVTPGTAQPFRFDAQGDHRLAMSAAVLARLHEVRVTLRGMNSVGKSFPGFWTEAAKAGVQVEPWECSSGMRWW